ncbi:hypothetical protein [Shimazuella kribbensis]|uniref:hypothetical protein n=1 Tax=Shimazuella kribbensis TaxID=139808 RepID=UPI000407FF3C|nr:hypothetical protein [Shimazuella kribbensis]
MIRLHKDLSEFIERLQEEVIPNSPISSVHAELDATLTIGEEAHVEEQSLRLEVYLVNWGAGLELRADLDSELLTVDSLLESIRGIAELVVTNEDNDEDIIGEQIDVFLRERNLSHVLEFFGTTYEFVNLGRNAAMMADS